MAQHHMLLPGDGTDFAAWRDALWAQQVPPHEVVWHTEDSQHHSPDLFADWSPLDTLPAHQPAPCPPLPLQTPPALTVPRSWLAQAEQALLHASPERFGLLYRMLWRMQHEPGLRHDPLDPDRVRMQHWIQAVRREVHKMHAFVRFRPVALPDAEGDGSGPLHMAWFEPEHGIVRAAAPFFVQRFANMRWAILTPRISLRWWPQAPDVATLAATQGIDPNHAQQPLRSRAGVLSWGPGAERSKVPPSDAGEALWLTYYAHTFNPARLKVATMRKEMPRKYWHNLPETQLISVLVQNAHHRSGAMLEATAKTAHKSRP